MNIRNVKRSNQQELKVIGHDVERKERDHDGHIPLK